MNIAQQIGEANRSLSLDSAALDFTKYAKCLMACRGQRDDALQLATARGASSRLRSMLEATISVKKVSDDILTKAPGRYRLRRWHDLGR